MCRVRVLTTRLAVKLEESNVKQGLSEGELKRVKAGGEEPQVLTIYGHGQTIFKH